MLKKRWSTGTEESRTEPSVTQKEDIGSGDSSNPCPVCRKPDQQRSLEGRKEVVGEEGFCVTIS